MALKLFITLIALLGVSYAQNPTKTDQKADSKPKPPEIKHLNPTEIQIGKIILNKKTREISFGAGLNMNQNLIEYLLATTMSDKVHETLFLTDIKPSNLLIAMKLLGIKESKELFPIRDPKTMRPTGKFPKVTKEVHQASLVDIHVEWTNEKKESQRFPVHQLIQHIEWPKESAAPQPNQEFSTKNLKMTEMPTGPWLSTGSYIFKNRLKADVGGIILAIFTNEQGIVNYQGKDRLMGDVWIPNKKVLPPLDSKVKIILKSHKPDKKN